MPLDLVREYKEPLTWQAIETDLREHQVAHMILSPTRWGRYKNEVTLEWNKVKFDRSRMDEIPDNQNGIYTFVVCPEVANHPGCTYLMYVGKAERQGLRTRIKQYFNEHKKQKPRTPIVKMISRWEKQLWVYFAPITDVHVIDNVENNLLESFVPPANQQFKGTLGLAIRALKA